MRTAMVSLLIRFNRTLFKKISCGIWYNFIDRLDVMIMLLVIKQPVKSTNFLCIKQWKYTNIISQQPSTP